MVGDIYTSSELMENLTMLCDEFGSRFAGSLAERAGGRIHEGEARIVWSEKRCPGSGAI